MELKKILVVDDLQIYHNTLASYLKEYNLYFAYNGQDGYNIAKEIIPDLIIIDNHMPIMTGEEMISKIYDNSQTTNIPIILMSAHYINVGCPFIYKPFDKNSIINIVNNIFQKTISI